MAPLSSSSKPDTGELAHITQEMYKKNLELADKNKTLLLLRTIDEIVLSSVTHPRSVAQQIADAVVEQTGYVSLCAILLPQDKDKLVPYGVGQDSITNDLELEIHRQILAAEISARSGTVAKALKTKKIQTTDQLRELLNHFSPLVADRLQAALGLKSLFICPLVVRHQPIGAMILGTRAQALSAAYQRRLIGRLTNVIAIAIDSTLLYHQNQETTQRLRTANRNLKALDKTKDEFISMASHQLRTPLTTIKGYLSMLLEGDAGSLKPKQREFVDYSFGGAERMVRLISDMLNVSRMSSGRFVIEPKPTDMAHVVADEVRQLQTHADAKQIQLIKRLPKPGTTVELDENKTRQVIMNFIDNAVYYTKPGGRVEVFLDYRDGKAVLAVKDNGIGVPKEAQAKLFAKFFRADNAKAARPDGTGLGLYMAKRVIEDQGGKIIFTSEEGKGSQFGFELPIKSKVESPRSKVGASNLKIVPG